MLDAESVKCPLHNSFHDMKPECWAAIRRILFKKIDTEPVSHRRVYYSPAGR